MTITLSGLSLSLGVNKSQLLYWNTHGLLPPPIRIEGKAQIFDEEQAKRTVIKILALKAKGKSLPEIKLVLSPEHAAS